MRFSNMLLGALFAFGLPVLQAASLQPVPAVPSSNANQAMMLGVTQAQDRVVAVGDHGVVLLSDDHGRNFRQAQTVPLSAPLTSVSFADADHGWAVGHWGAVLATIDGGEHWTIQRLSSEEDRPLFAVHFFDTHRGVAVGLWSLVLTTDDGGATWIEQSLPAPPGSPRADLNLISLFADGRDRLYATAERGMLLRSDDRGHSWHYLNTGYDGSLWSGAVLPDGELLVGGQRGKLLRGSADGSSWKRIPLKSRSSITTIRVLGRQVLAAGLDGLLVSSGDGGRTFKEERTAEGVSITAVLADNPERTLFFSRRGVIPEPQP